jgi:hypothetical protein
MTLRFPSPVPLGLGHTPGLEPLAPGSMSPEEVLAMRLGVPQQTSGALGFSPGRIPNAIGGFVSKNEKPLSVLGKTALGAYQVYSDYAERKARRDEERRQREEADRKRREQEAAGQALAPVGAQILEALSRRLGTRVGGP